MTYRRQKIIALPLIISLLLVTGCVSKDVENDTIDKVNDNKQEITKDNELENKSDSETNEQDKKKENKEDYRKIKLDEFKKALSSVKYKELPGDTGVIYEDTGKAYVSATVGNTYNGGFVRSKLIGAYKLPDTEMEFKANDKTIKSIYNLFLTMSKSDISKISYDEFLNTINNSIKNEVLDENDLGVNIFPIQEDEQINQYITTKDNTLQFIIVEDENKNVNKYEYKVLDESRLNEDIKSWNNKLRVGLNEVANKLGRSLNVVNNDYSSEQTYDFKMGDDIYITNKVEYRKPVSFETNGSRFGNSTLTIQCKGSDYKEKLHYILESVIPIYNEIFGLSIKTDELKSYVECEEIYKGFFNAGNHLLNDIEYFDIEKSAFGEPSIGKAIDNFSKYGTDKMASPAITVDADENYIGVEIDVPFKINEIK